MTTHNRKIINNNGQVQNPDSTETRADYSLRGTRSGSDRAYAAAYARACSARADGVIGPEKLNRSGHVQESRPPRTSNERPLRGVRPR
jgi:hypothetical protein